MHFVVFMLNEFSSKGLEMRRTVWATGKHWGDVGACLILKVMAMDESTQ